MVGAGRPPAALRFCVRATLRQPRALHPSRERRYLPGRRRPTTPAPLYAQFALAAHRARLRFPVSPDHLAAARTLLQSLTLGGERLGAARSTDTRAGSGEPGPPAARLREDDPALPPGRPPPDSHLPHKLTQDTELSSRVLIQHNPTLLKNRFFFWNRV